MNINIIYAAEFDLPDHDLPDSIKNIAPTWGSWKTWHQCRTDNVICHDLGKARELQKRSFHTVCNLYLPQKFHQLLGRPVGINYYQGEFLLDTLDLEDVISMHLVSASSDLVLMFGFDISNPGVVMDRMQKHRMTNRLGLIRQCIAANPDVQWALIDHAQDPDSAFQNLPNLTRDSLQNVLTLLV
jgi:hypothetical protein